MSSATDPSTTKLGAGFRTTWTDQCVLGGGFHRDINTPAAAAVRFAPAKADALKVSQQFIRGYFKMVTSSSEFSEMCSAGGGISMEGWGASAAATFSATDQMTLKTNALTAVVSMRFMSEPINAVNPSNSEQQVTLNEPAKKVLETEGPDAFHARYGTHFIAGYIKGGYLIGSYAMEFSTEEHAQKYSGSVKASFSDFGMKAEGSAEFEKKVNSLNEHTTSTGQYTCSGWSDKYPPKLACSLKDLALAHDQFEVDNGILLEAVLMSYRDIPQYATSRAVYFNGKTDDYDETFIDPDSYGTIVRTLNAEYGRLRYIYQFLKDHPTNQGLIQLANQANAAMQLYKKTLLTSKTAGRTIAQVRAALKDLEVYLVVFNRDKPDADASDVLKAQWQRGLDRIKQMFVADQLEKQMQGLLPKAGPAPPPLPKRLGAGWTIDTSDGHLRFYHDGDQKFVVHNATNGNKVWTREWGDYVDNVVVKDQNRITIRSGRNGTRLANDDGRGLFNNTNRLEWETLFIEKL